MRTLNHTQALKALHASLSRTISPGQQAALEAHLAGCPACRLEAERLSALDASLRHSLHAHLDAGLVALPGPLTDPLSQLKVQGRRRMMKPGFSLSSGITLTILLICFAAALVWLLPRSGVIPAGTLSFASPAVTGTPQATPRGDDRPTTMPAPAPAAMPGALVPPPQSVCDEAMGAISGRLKMPARLRYDALFNNADPIVPLPTETGRGCEIRWEGLMTYGSLQEVFDQITPWVLYDQKYRTDSFGTSFRHWWGTYRQSYRLAQIEAAWQPLPSEACPGQDIASDCPLLAEQKRLEVTLRLADDPLTQAIDESLTGIFDGLAARDAQALESLTPALREQLKDLAGLNQALGIDAKSGKFEYTFEVRSAGLGRASIALTVWQRFGRTREWRSERLVGLRQQGERWRIESIQPSPP